MDFLYQNPICFYVYRRDVYFINEMHWENMDLFGIFSIIILTNRIFCLLLLAHIYRSIMIGQIILCALYESLLT